MRWLIATALILGVVVPASAQATDVPPVRRLEVDAGAGWLGGTDLGATDATLRTPSRATDTVRLFSLDSRFAAASTFHVRAGLAVNRRFGIEGGLTVSHPELQASVSDDAEAAPPITVAERIDQYSVDASVIVLIRELGLGGRTIPFVTAGAGYLRQLHEGRTVVEQGHAVHAGGGVKHRLLARSTGLLRGAGLRADVRMYFMSGAVEFEESPKPRTAVSGSFFVTF